MMPEVRAALKEVQRLHPQVNIVLYLPDATWRFFDTDGEIPAFKNGINVSILEDAFDAVDNRHKLPVVFCDTFVSYDPGGTT